MIWLLAPVPIVAAPECDGVPIRQMVGRYAELQRAQDSESIARLFGADGTIENPGAAPIRGSAAIRAFLGGFHGYSVTTNELTIVNVEPSGDDWRVTGRFRQTGQTPDRKAYETGGHFDSLWRCGADGWQVRRMAAGR